MRMIRDMMSDSERDLEEDNRTFNENKISSAIHEFLNVNDPEPDFEVMPNDQDVNDAEYDYDRPSIRRDFWYEEAKMALQRRVSGSVDARSRSARSVILMVGDGMGLATVTAARILKGQRLGQTGEDTNLAWDKFPATALAKVTSLFNSVVKIVDFDTVTAARILEGQRLGQTGEDTNLAWDKFPATALAKVTSLFNSVVKIVDFDTVTAARILEGQRLGQTGEDTNLAWDKFPATALAKVTSLFNSVVKIVDFDTVTAARIFKYDRLRHTREKSLPHLG
ncbi:hypothetical protein J6590_084471 [Homalodisca vitripennis]|nr:hypothetical protein J6590_084471 [Homalodisca vitripennis]